VVREENRRRKWRWFRSAGGKQKGFGERGWCVARGGGGSVASGLDEAGLRVSWNGRIKNNYSSLEGKEIENVPWLAGSSAVVC
jgi:hypothetical protein